MKAALTACVLLATFLLGVLAPRPDARALEAFLGTVGCASSSPCSGGVNGSTGPGVTGASKMGNGVYGWTQSTGGTAAKGKAGVYGQDLSSNGAYNAGVWGTSSAGAGLLGVSTAGNGVVGKIDKANGTNAAVFGEDSSNGFVSYTAGVRGTSGGGSGVYGSASGADGIGVNAYASLGTALSAETDGTGYPALVIFSTGGGDIADAVGSNDSEFYVDANANLHTTGELVTGGSCSSGCARHRRVQAYATTATLPTMQDDGESAVVRGAVSVRLDPAFANAIDPGQGYLVQITPEGDTRGLYVASRSATGFVVREVMGGRGNVAFAYHIVAHPYGVRARRLPFVDFPDRSRGRGR